MAKIPAISRALIPAVFLMASLGLALAPTAQAGTAASFNVACPLSHVKPDDPIVFPGVAGASHMHNFYGNNSTSAVTTEQSLLAAPSDCVRGFGDTDHSAYWVPTLYVRQSGVLQPVLPSHATIYYQGDGSAGQKIVAFPQGLRMIAGNSRTTTPQSTSIVSWHCVSSNSNLGALSASMPTCGSGQTLTSTVHFPSCWDGHNLDSADHQSHMAYIHGTTCPADHPVRVPALMYSITYKDAHAAATDYVLSSGSPYSMHADFFAAWNNQVQSALVNSCLNQGKHCNDMDRSQVDLSAATPGSPTDKVLGAATQATPSPQAVQASVTKPAAPTLPDTGATLGTILGLTALGFTFYYYRKHKHAILTALRHPHA